MQPTTDTIDRVNRQARVADTRGLQATAAGLRTRSSIIAYLERQAVHHEVAGRSDTATSLRAEASNIAAQLDVVAGLNQIVSPAQAIIRETVAAFGGASVAEVTGPSRDRAAVRVRTAAIWVAKKRLGWSDERLAADFHRERSSLHSATQRGDDIRREDVEFRQITDRLVAADIRCEHCDMPLAPTADAGVLAAVSRGGNPAQKSTER